MWEGAIETAEELGKRIYAEAVRRGLLRAQQVIVLGDGAPWIWALAEEHFPGALQIVDLYHAREHLSTLAKALYGAQRQAHPSLESSRYQELEAGDVEAVVAAMKRARPRDRAGREELRKAIGYFQTKINTERMRYAKFRRRGVFVGWEWWKPAARSSWGGASNHQFDRLKADSLLGYTMILA